jgi:hypothetical protein
MIRGVSAEFIFDLPCQYLDLKSAQVAFWQEDYYGPSDLRRLPIIKTLEYCKRGPKPTQLSVTLSREETARFTELRKAYVQFAGVKMGFDANGNAVDQGIGHKKEMITVYPIHNSLEPGEIILPTINHNDLYFLDGGELFSGDNDVIFLDSGFVTSNNNYFIFLDGGNVIEGV